MPSLNTIRIIGHLGKDPEAKEVGSGTVVSNFSVAVSSGTKERPKTQWFRCTAWGSMATDLAMNGKKGDVVDVTGRMESRKWEEKEIWELIVAHMHLTKKKGKTESEFEEE
jgi:single-strand DNA-binding protein